MENTRGTLKGVLYAFLQFIFLLQLSSLVVADVTHDISFWEHTTCYGQSAWCYGAAEAECCGFDTPDFFALGLQVVGASSCAIIHTFHSGACQGPDIREYGGNCNPVLALTGAFFYDSISCRRRSLLEDPPVACKRKLTPNGLGFREDGKTGHWVLKVPNATELYSQLASVPVEEKVNWLLSQGAAYEELL